MKLVVVFMLAAIPMCCYASGSGCSDMDNIIDGTISSSVSQDDYHALIKEIVRLPYDKESVSLFKQCFLDQSEETLDNVKTMV
ncbi:hypothetical protein STEG23_031818, partial [Scotinomys teguina]